MIITEFFRMIFFFHIVCAAACRCAVSNMCLLVSVLHTDLDQIPLQRVQVAVELATRLL